MKKMIWSENYLDAAKTIAAEYLRSIGGNPEQVIADYAWDITHRSPESEEFAKFFRLSDRPSFVGAESAITCAIKHILFPTVYI